MIYIALGSNLGNRFAYLDRAVSLLKARFFNELSCSIILETDCILPEGAPAEWNKPFLNMVVAGTCDIPPDLLLQGLKHIEHELGRPPGYQRWSPRVIDLDILLWNDSEIKTPELTIPHPEIANRPFLIHLLTLMGAIKTPLIPDNCFTQSFTLSPRFVGIVNVTADSFSDGGICDDPDKAIDQAIDHAKNGAIVELGAQSTRPGAVIHGPKAEFERLKPVLDGLKPLMESGEVVISIDTFWPEVVTKLLAKYPIAWINDVKGDLDKETLQKIAEHDCKICIMHSLGIPPQKDRLIPLDTRPMSVIKDWAYKNIEQLSGLGFGLESIIIDPGIGFGKSAYQSIGILQHLEVLKECHVKVLIGHSRKSYLEAFSNQVAKDRDIETLAISSLIANKADYLRVHNFAEHMRFFVAQKVIEGGRDAS